MILFAERLILYFISWSFVRTGIDGWSLDDLTTAAWLGQKRKKPSSPLFKTNRDSERLVCWVS
jgi:hypothetical protein